MYIAIDIGGTKTLVAAFAEDGTVLDRQKHETELDFDNFMERLIDEITHISQGQHIDAIAVAAPALIDEETGMCKVFGNLPWRDVDIISPLKETFTNNVFIDNDAKMGALGEANLGAGKEYENCLYITLSTGIGIGVTFKGQLDNALHHSEAGFMEFEHDGHLIAWEKFASGRAFFEKYHMKGADDDNPEHWKAWSADVGQGLLNLISVIQPDAVIIGGSMGEHFEKYHQYLQGYIQENRAPIVDMPVILEAQDPENAVINGCYVVCRAHSQA